MEDMASGLARLAPMMGLPSIPLIRFGEALPQPTREELLVDTGTVAIALGRLAPDIELLHMLESP